MLPERVGSDSCRVAERWGLSLTLAERVVRLNEWAKVEFVGYWPGLYVISGRRSLEENVRVGGAPDSRHIRCPSEGVDLRIGTVVGIDVGNVWAILGGKWELSFWGRWGGRFEWSGSPLPNPKEWNHFDLG